jgi:DNA-binding NtrC family response regulator
MASHMNPFGETILLVDDDLDFQEIVTDRLVALGYRVFAASNGQEGLALLEKEGPQIVLLDIEMPDMNGLEVLKAMRTRAHDVTVVMLTAYGTIERAVQAMKQGAYDFIPKPFEPEHLVLTVQKALERERLKREVAILSEAVGERYRQVVGQSATMQQALEMAKKVASSHATVLLLGESGTGKELFARAIHDWSARRTKPFIAINCVALAKDLLESELFGHEKGAFTGAHQLKKGKLELAQGGTVFLDEVGDLAPELQAKLLRFLQEREFERLGGTTVIQVDARMIAATNRDLAVAIREGRFREDLYYRLNVVAIPLPPLRARKDDIPALAHFFLRRFAAETKKPFTGITPDAQARLLAYDWPGNIRELQNVMERAVVLGHGPQVTLQDLPASLVAAEPPTSSTSLTYHAAIHDFRCEFIRRALAQAQGNHAAAAKALGLQRTYLQRLLRTLHID